MNGGDGRVTRREVLQRAASAAVVGGVAGSARSQEPPPNLLLMVTDDQRWDALGCLGDPVLRTPAIDRLAGGGVLFTNNFCTTSICCASRASIFTGQYAARHGINDFGSPFSASAWEQTYPALLRAAGYRTGFVGKWGVGGPLPRERFDDFQGFPGQGRYEHVVDGRPVHLTTILTDQATEFLAGCDRDRPFCLSVSFKAAHAQDGQPHPFRYDPAFAGLYREDTIRPPKTAAPEYFEALPEFLRTSEGRVRWRRRFATPELYEESVKGYYRLISGIDRAVARIVATLEERGLADRTVILFTSDNGFFLGEHGLAGKWLMHEESIRTPLIIADPRQPIERRGRRCEAMALNIDLAPTLLDLAGVQAPARVQGRSLAPWLAGKAPTWRDEWFYEHRFVHPRIPQNEGVRTARWKYIRYVDREPLYEELYDLRDDPLEERNLAPLAEHRRTLERLRDRWESLRASAR